MRYLVPYLDSLNNISNSISNRNEGNKLKNIIGTAFKPVNANVGKESFEDGQEPKIRCCNKTFIGAVELHKHLGVNLHVNCGSIASSANYSSVTTYISGKDIWMIKRFISVTWQHAVVRFDTKN